jgi:molecular chaperone GrpE (heat shock protein)
MTEQRDPLGSPGGTPVIGDGAHGDDAEAAVPVSATLLPREDTETTDDSDAEFDVTEPVEEASQPATVLSEMNATLAELVNQAESFHARAEQREGIIDHLHRELERLRTGERREVLRPLLVELGRLRHDLLRQAEELPADYDATRASDLLRSYAETVSDLLEDNGVVSYAPEQDERFEPRRHRKVGDEPNDDPGRGSCVAKVRRDGYLDLATDVPLAPAQVVLFKRPAANESPAAIDESEES